MKPRSDSHIAELVKSAQEGDKDAFAHIYDHYFEPIYRYVYYRVQKDQVEDLVESVFIKTWVNLQRFEQRDVSFGAWLFRIAHNVVIDHRRTHRPVLPIHPETRDTSERGAPMQRAHKALVADELRKAMNELKENHRQVITLKFLLGFPNEEVAQILNIKEGNVRVLQFRALKALKKVLEGKGFKYEFL